MSSGGASTAATYREVFGVAEFRALFCSQLLSTLGDQITRVAVALLVFERSGSAFAAAATFAVGYLTWLVGGPTLAGLADRYSRTAVMITCDLVRAALVAALALPGLPLPTVFVVLVAAGALAPPFDGARSAVLPDVLDGDRFVVGSGLMTAVFQLGHLGGFVTGGALVALLGVQGALLLDAATFLVSGGLILALVRPRRAPRTADRAPWWREMSAGVAVVRHTRRLRWLLVLAAVSAATVIPAEGLAVAVADELGSGALAVGLLTGAVPGGFVLGSLLVLRIPPAVRVALLPVLAAATCLPLLLSPLVDSLPLLVGLWALAGVGNSLQLVANAEYVVSTPPHLRARAFGVAGSTLMATQGATLLLAGALAEVLDPRVVVAGCAGVVLLLLPAVMRLAPEADNWAQGRAIRRRWAKG